MREDIKKQSESLHPKIKTRQSFEKKQNALKNTCVTFCDKRTRLSLQIGEKRYTNYLYGSSGKGFRARTIWRNGEKAKRNYPIFPIISPSLEIFPSNSLNISSHRFVASSLFPLSSDDSPTMTFESSFWEVRSSSLCFSRNDFSSTRGLTISVRREPIYFSESKRFPLFAFFSILSSFNTSSPIRENVTASFSNPECNTPKF